MIEENNKEIKKVIEINNKDVKEILVENWIIVGESFSESRQASGGNLLQSCLKAFPCQLLDYYHYITIIIISLRLYHGKYIVHKSKG